MAVKKATKTPAKPKAAPPKKKAASKSVGGKTAPSKAASKAAAKKAPPKTSAKSAATVKRPAKKPPAKATPSKAPAKQVAAPAKAAPTKTGAPKAEAKKASAPVREAPPRPTSAGLDKAFLAEQRLLLEEERVVYLTQAEEYEAEADMLARELETGDVSFDEEAGEGGAATVDRERDLVLANQARATVEQIDAALKRLDAGRYGLCTQCGQKIPRPRLRAIPYTDLCVDCKAGGLLHRR